MKTVISVCLFLTLAACAALCQTANDPKVDELLKQAIQLDIDGDMDKAIEKYTEAIKLAPSNMDALLKRGICFMKNENFDSAMEDFSTMIKIDPNSFDGYLNRGIAFDAKGSRSNAIKDYNKAIQIKPDSDETYPYLGYTYMNLYDYDKAEEIFSRAIELKSDRAEYFYLRGECRLALENNSLALKDFSRAIELDSEFGAAYYGRALINKKNNNPSAALKDFSKAIELIKADDDALAACYIHRSIIYSEKGDDEKAIADLRIISQLNVSNEIKTVVNSMLNGEPLDGKSLSEYSEFENAEDSVASMTDSIEKYNFALDRSKFVDCLEQLGHIRVGLESYLTEYGNLTKLDPYAEFACDMIIPGYSKASLCKGKVRKTVEAVCQSYSVKKYGEDGYEIKGVSTDSRNCCLIITETGSVPKDYSECSIVCPKAPH